MSTILESDINLLKILLQVYFALSASFESSRYQGLQAVPYVT